MRCSKCGTPVSIKPLYRTNEKGEPAIWMCEACLAAPPDTDVKRVVDAIHPALK